MGGTLPAREVVVANGGKRHFVGVIAALVALGAGALGCAEGGPRQTVATAAAPLVVSAELELEDVTRIALGEDGATALVARWPETDGLVLVRTSRGWQAEATLTCDPFGLPALALSGDTAVVGSCVYERGTDGWVLESELPIEWHHSLALDDDTAVIGDPSEQAAHVLVRDGALWREEAVLRPPEPHEEFGASVAIDGDRIVVGAPSDAGSAFVFLREGGTWIEEAELVIRLAHPEEDEHEWVSAHGLGREVALDGHTALVGVHLESGPLRHALGEMPTDGERHDYEAVAFVRQPEGWREQSWLRGDGDGQGQGLALDGDVAAVGSRLITRRCATWSDAGWLVGAGLQVAIQRDAAATAGGSGSELGGIGWLSPAYLFHLEGRLGDACARDDDCSEGRCIAKICQPADPCDDGESCTVDSCDLVEGCRHQPFADGTPCIDGECRNGVCAEVVGGGGAGGTDDIEDPEGSGGIGGVGPEADVPTCSCRWEHPEGESAAAAWLLLLAASVGRRRGGRRDLT